MIVKLALDGREVKRPLFGHEIMQSFIDNVSNAIDVYDWNAKRIKEIDQEINELLHVAECKTLDAVGMVKNFKNIQELRIERRVLLNERATLAPLIASLKEDEMLRKLYRINHKCSERKMVLNNREFRVDGEESEEIKDFYKNSKVGVDFGDGDVVGIAQISSLSIVKKHYV